MKKEELKEVLMLLIDNEHISASTAGLKERAENRRVAINRLLSELNIGIDKAEDFYWKWQAKRR